MSEVSACQSEIVNWHPQLGDGSLSRDVALETVHGTLDIDDDMPLTLFLVGLGEGRVSGEAVVRYWGELGMPAVAAWLSYRALPVCEANLTRTAVEAPLAIADYYAEGRQVHLVTNSLGCLGVNAAAEAPERFSEVASVAPYALANEYRGRLPVIGSPFVLRAGALGVSLGVRTPLQLLRDCPDPNLLEVAKTAAADARLFGLSGYRVALDHALSVAIGRRTADSYIRLLDSHPELIVVGSDDRLVQPDQVRQTLQEAARRNGVDPEVAARTVVEVPGPHTPWCIPRGLKQLAPVREWMAYGVVGQEATEGLAEL